MLDIKFMGKHRLEMTAFGYGSCMSFWWESSASGFITVSAFDISNLVHERTGKWLVWTDISAT